MPWVTKRFSGDDLSEPAGMLRDGYCVAFPTETVYGLGANALDSEAVQRIFAAKGRPADNPLIVHCCSVEQVCLVARPWQERVQRLMDTFWPGPLTLVLPKQPVVPLTATAGLDTVAVRIPDHPVALALFRLAGVPVAAPSANVSGRPSPTRVEHVMDDLDGRIPGIVDGGPTGWGVESTVLDCSVYPYRLLRPGGVTFEELSAYAEVELDPGMFSETIASPRSPGMKYKHYAPECRVVIVTGRQAAPVIRKLAAKDMVLGKQVGVMAFSEHSARYPHLTVLDLGSKYALQEGASRLYHLLREADALGLDILYVEGLPEKELGMAIMNRLRRAAGYHVIDSERD